MKKKLLSGLTGITLLFALILTGCEQPSDYTITQELPSVPGPGDLRAEAYDGVNYVWWNSVANASGYRVVRRDTQTGETKVLDSVNAVVGSRLVYSDTVRWSNQLVNDRTYEYTVISLNQNAINSVRATTDPVLSGESKTSVNAKVPTTLDIKTPGNIQTKTYTENNVDFLLVTFDGEPNQQYTVAYTYGKGGTDQIIQNINLLGTDAFVNGSDGDLFTKTKVARFPLIGGDNTVTVQTTFAGGTEYYAGVKSGTAAVKGTFTSLGAIQGFATARNGENIRFEWTDIANSTADSYVIYKAQTSVDSNAAAQGFSREGVEVIGDWTKVTFLTKPQKIGVTTWEAYEKESPLGGNYTYAIIATVGTLKTRPAMAALSSQGPYNLPGTGNFKVRYANTSTATTIQGEVRATWAPVDGVAYTLSYAQAEAADTTQPFGVNNYKLLTDYKDVTQTATNTTTVSNFTTVLVADPGKSKTFIFKLIGTKGGAQSLEFYPLNDGPYATTVGFKLLRVVGPADPLDSTYITGQTTEGYGIKLQLANPGETTYRGIDYTFTLYYRTKEHLTYQTVTLAANVATLKADTTPTVAGGHTNTIDAWQVVHPNLGDRLVEYKLVAKGYESSPIFLDLNDLITNPGDARPHNYGLDELEQFNPYGKPGTDTEGTKWIQTIHYGLAGGTPQPIGAFSMAAQDILGSSPARTIPARSFEVSKDLYDNFSQLTVEYLNNSTGVWNGILGATRGSQQYTTIQAQQLTRYYITLPALNPEIQVGTDKLKLRYTNDRIDATGTLPAYVNVGN